MAVYLTPQSSMVDGVNAETWARWYVHGTTENRHKDALCNSDVTEGRYIFSLLSRVLRCDAFCSWPEALTVCSLAEAVDVDVCVYKGNRACLKIESRYETAHHVAANIYPQGKITVNIGLRNSSHLLPVDMFTIRQAHVPVSAVA